MVQPMRTDPDPRPETPDQGKALMEFMPINDLEERMVRALSDGNQEEYLRLLADAELALPVTSTNAAATGAHPWGTMEHEGRTFLVAYTSKRAMDLSTNGQFPSARWMTFTELAAEWPDVSWWLVIDPGLPLAVHLPTDLLRQLAGGEFSLTADERDEDDNADRFGAGMVAELVAAPVESTEDGPTIMQKVIPASHVPFYLDKGYDWIAGYVHRWQDVAELTTAPDMVENLGLSYEGSPFSLHDRTVFVIRWTAYRAELYRTPLGGTDEESMRAVPGGWVVENPPFTGTGYVPHSRLAIPEYKIESVRLPHQAEMWRIDSDGEHRFVAVYDADSRHWLVNRDLL